MTIRAGGSKARTGPSPGRFRHVLGVITTLLSVSSYTMTAGAFRTAQDSRELQGVGRVAWLGGSPEFHLNRDGIPEGLDPTAVEAALAAALEAWSAPECTTVEPGFAGWIETQGAPGDEMNTVQWSSEWSQLGLPLDAPGHADIQYRGSDGTWEIAEADIYLNAESFSWIAGSDAAPLDLGAVLTHELGHALGLLHPCEPDGAEDAPICGERGAVEAETTMFPLYSVEQSTLAPDDQDGICFLYPECGGCAKNQVCLDGECRATCAGEPCESGLVCGYWGCSLPGTCLSADCTGDPCEGDQTCAPLGRCESGVCIRGNADLGGRCSVNADCESGVCVGGTCEPACLGEQSCGKGGMCVLADGPPARGCVQSGSYPFGTACARGEDCQSGVCITEGAQSFCTSVCESDSACRPQYRCESVDGTTVCVRNRLRSGGGCAMSSSGSRSGAIVLVGLGLFVATMWRRGRSRK